MRMIQRVEHLHLELMLEMFFEPRILDDGEISLDISRRTEDVPARITVGARIVGSGLKSRQVEPMIGCGVSQDSRGDAIRTVSGAGGEESRLVAHRERQTRLHHEYTVQLPAAE